MILKTGLSFFAQGSISPRDLIGVLAANLETDNSRRWAMEKASRLFFERLALAE